MDFHSQYIIRPDDKLSDHAIRHRRLRSTGDLEAVSFITKYAGGDFYQSINGNQYEKVDQSTIPQDVKEDLFDKIDDLNREPASLSDSSVGSSARPAVPIYRADFAPSHEAARYVEPVSTDAGLSKRADRTKDLNLGSKQANCKKDGCQKVGGLDFFDAGFIDKLRNDAPKKCRYEGVSI